VMKIYRHRESKKTYTITLIHLDLTTMDCNASAGVSAYPYCCKADVIHEPIKYWNSPVDLKKKEEFEAKCAAFIDVNFELVAEA